MNLKVEMPTAETLVDPKPQAVKVWNDGRSGFRPQPSA